MSAGYIYLIVGIILSLAGVASLVTGKTIGLYGVIETRTSIFYWIISITYITLGILLLFGALRIFLR